MFGIPILWGSIKRLEAQVMGKLKIEEILIPYGLSKVDYFKMGVLWNLAGENKPKIRHAEKGESLTLKKREIIKLIAEAVPGQRSYLMDLTIRSNIHECVIDNFDYTLEEKVEIIAASISRYVVV